MQIRAVPEITIRENNSTSSGNPCEPDTTDEKYEKHTVAEKICASLRLSLLVSLCPGREHDRKMVPQGNGSTLSTHPSPFSAAGCRRRRSGEHLGTVGTQLQLGCASERTAGCVGRRSACAPHRAPRNIITFYV